MEIGPLSEWVTAIAEISAVCVALFLPLLNARHEKRKREIKFKITAKRLIRDAITGNRSAQKKLTLFTQICFYICDSEKEVEPIIKVSKISNIINNSKKLTDEQIAEIEDLMKDI